MRRVIVFLKTPRPGLVKTRLASELDAESAAAICRVLIERSMEALRNEPSVEIRYAPDDAGEETAAMLRPGWRAMPQGVGDLGERLARAVSAAGQDGAGPIVIVGTDTPDLVAEDLEAAFAAMEEHDVVLGPAYDGGYWLVGMRHPMPELFVGIPWSTPRVLEATMQRAKESGLRVKLLRKLRDIDTLDDWRRWQRERAIT